MTSLRALACAVLILHEAGKALTHTTRGLEWAHRPMFDGLAISDAWHLFSASLWPSMFLLAWLAYGARWRWWVATVASWAIVWQAAKMVAGKAWAPGWLQILRWLT